MSGDQSSLFAWVLAGVTTVIGALTTALSVLYKSRVAAYEKAEIKLDTRVEMLEQKLDKCEEEHTNAKIEVARINERLRLLEAKGCLNESCHSRSIQ